MNLHENPRTTPHGRALMVRRVLKQEQPATKVAADFGISERTVRQRRLPSAQVAAIEALRRQRLTSRVIARRLGRRLKSLDPLAPVVRYRRQPPGELVHIDTTDNHRSAGSP